MSQVVPMQASTSMSRIESVLIAGDLSKLSVPERETYYLKVCETLGLNPLTRPFDYLTLNNKLVMYANKGCAEQLRSIRSISISVTAREMIGDLFVVTAEASDPAGRRDGATGAVNTAGLKGDALANAMMKAETKAKRRVTLSICGLNMLDETEIGSIPDHEKGPPVDVTPPSASAPNREPAVKPNPPASATGQAQKPEPSPEKKARLEVGAEIMKVAMAINLKDTDMADWVVEIFKKPMKQLTIDEMKSFLGVLQGELQMKLEGDST